MGRRKNEAGPTVPTPLILLSVSLVTCGLVYACFSTVLATRGTTSFSSSSVSVVEEVAEKEKKEKGCCRGIEELELWGDTVKWGSDLKFNTSEQCCNACKSMCTRNDGPCLCDTWVFCGDPLTCASKFRQCWLKKQKDNLAPESQAAGPAGEAEIWTSGLIYGKGEGIIAMETEYGTLHVKLFPDCAPYSVAYILELLPLHYCAGCQFYRAESRGQSWDSEGNHVKNAAFGPPFALIQGKLEPKGNIFRELPIEDCPTIRRGSVAWIGSGPDFFISLANHVEWKKEYTVFGSILPEDMHIAERISTLPTLSDVWDNINVSVLEKPVPLMLRRIKKNNEDLDDKAASA